MDLELAIQVLSNPEKTLISGDESDPYLVLYMSEDVDIKQKLFYVSDIAHKSLHQITMGIDDLPSTIDFAKACLCIQMICFVEIKDDETGSCYKYKRKTPIGECAVPLVDIQSAYKNDLSIILDIQDMTPLVGGFSRFSIKLSFMRIIFTNKIALVDNNNLETESIKIKKMVMLYKQYENFYKTHEPTHPILVHMHIPSWRNICPITIPACMWIFHTTTTGGQTARAINLALRLVEVALELYDWTKEQLIFSIESQFKQSTTEISSEFFFALRVLSTAVCMTAYASDYLFDTCAAEDTERFKTVISGFFAGDCEDLAWEIYRNCMTFISNGGFVQQNTNYYSPEKTKFFLTIRKVFLLYLPCILTGSAYNPNMKNRPVEIEPENQYICHVFAGMFPRFEFLNRLSVIEPQRLQMIETVKKELEQYPWERYLPSIIQEGTNMNCPLMLHPLKYTKSEKVCSIMSQVEEYRQLIENQFKCLKNLTIEILPEADPNHIQTPENFSTFYHCINNVWVDLRKFGCQFCDLSVGYGTREKHSYGIPVLYWSDYQNHDFTFEPVFHYSSNHYAICIEVIQKQYPIKLPVHFETKDQPKTLSNCKIPKSLIDLQNLVNNKRFDTIPEHSSPWNRNYISYRINHWNKISHNEKILRSLRQVLIDKYFVNIRVLEYPIIADQSLYIGEIRLYLKKGLFIL